jgi:long-chain fatty acid transport protein
MSRRATAAASLAILGIFVLADSARAGGMYISEFGTPSLGTANAGAPAGTDDASTAIHNPAAMTRLDEHQISAGGAAAFSFIEFDPDSDTPIAGSDGGNQGGFAPIMGAQYVHKLSDRWRFGMAFLSISGSVLDPDNDWVGRNVLTESSLLSITLLPTLAYRVTDWLSFGAGPALTYGVLNYELKTRLPGEPKVKLDELDDFAAGAVVSGDIKIPVGVTPSINLELPLAQTVRWGIHWDVTDRVALLASGDWEDWSTAKSLPVSVAGLSAALPLKFKDTWKGSIGMHYRWNKKWLLQTGFTYDSSPLDNSDRTVAFPIDRQTRLGFGARYDWSDSMRVGLTFEWLNLGKAKVNTSGVKGEYSTNDVIFFGFNASWKNLPWRNWGTF